jgi:hypothetical protein
MAWSSVVRSGVTCSAPASSDPSTLPLLNGAVDWAPAPWTIDRLSRSAVREDGIDLIDDANVEIGGIAGGRRRAGRELDARFGDRREQRDADALEADAGETVLPELDAISCLPT